MRLLSQKTLPVHWLFVVAVVFPIALSARANPDTELSTYQRGIATVPQTQADSDDGIAAYRRGVAVYDRGDWEGARVHFRAAFRKFLPLAERGIPEFQYYVAMLYRRYLGLKIRVARPEAVKWMRRAAEQKLAVAQLELGLMYKYGEGVLKDLSEAHKWYIRAAENGGQNYQLLLGASYFEGSDHYGIPRDDERALEWIRRASANGAPRAFFLLAAMFDEGRGVERNLPEAIRLYEKAANKGVAEAQASLGHIYYMGDGVARDCATSAGWFLKAARLNLGYAQFVVARMYQTGSCMPTNSVKAFVWYSNAWKQPNWRCIGSNGALMSRYALERQMSKPEIHEADTLWRRWSPTGAPSFGYRFAVPRPSCSWLKQFGGRIPALQ